jgi:SAM-dependent methyltransferase
MVALRLAVCRNCWLLQITDIVPPQTLFEDYPYFSSVSDTMVQHAGQAAEKHRLDGNLDGSSLVIEIASNDGYLLEHFVRAKIPCIGIEPAANVARVARERGVDTRVEFFTLENARQLAKERGRADLILGNNVFAHVPEPNDFVAGLAALVQPSGRIVLEFPEACSLVDKVEFDTIYHEHVFYFSLTALMPLFSRHGLEVFDVETLTIHGGSLRLYAAPQGQQPVHDRVGERLAFEADKGVATLDYYRDFQRQVHQVRNDLLHLLHQLHHQGKRIAAYGASAKGSTLLNFCGIGRHGIDCLEFVADRSPAKIGRLTPGSHLPIVSPDELLNKKPDYALLLTWNFAEEILQQQQAYRDAGGKFIVPLPEVRVV